MLDSAKDRWVVDCDTHFWQPLDLWESYLPADKRDVIRKIIEENTFVPAAVRARLEESMRIKGADHAKERIEWMDQEGIDACVIYPSGMAYLCYHEDIDIAVASCNALNRWAADFASLDPDRLLPCMVLPWYHPEEALKEFHAAKKLGFKLAFSTPTPSARHRWSDPVYDPLWKALQDEGIVMTFHEFTRIPIKGGASNFVARESYKDQYPMMYLCGHTVELQLAAMDMLLGGVCDRFPKLYIGFVEGHAAWVQGWLEMLDSIWERPLTANKREEMGLGNSLMPSELFKRQCYVAGFPNDRGLDLLVEKVGPQVVSLCTDYPHPQTTYGMVKLFEKSYPKFDEKTRNDLLGQSVWRFIQPQRS